MFRVDKLQSPSAIRLCGLSKPTGGIVHRIDECALARAQYNRISSVVKRGHLLDSNCLDWTLELNRPSRRSNHEVRPGLKYDSRKNASRSAIRHHATRHGNRFGGTVVNFKEFNFR